MSRARYNTQMFALRKPPPSRIELAGRRYRLLRVFKHDFFAATCLYEAENAPAPKGINKIVVKFGRVQGFCGIPLSWYGRWLRAHEEAVYKALAGVKGVPRWVGRFGETSYGIEYIEAKPLDHVEQVQPGFFSDLRRILDDIHTRGVGYCDANKRSNILVAPDGEPFLVDYQLAVRRRDDLPWPLRTIIGHIVRRAAEMDLYHVYKHKRRMLPDKLTPAELALSRRRSLLHTLHRRLTDPWRWVRRRLLRQRYRKGALQSPTAELEDHRQPEKATWRESY